MELQFQKKLIPCLKTAMQEVQNQEQTLEIKLPEGLPDVGRILAGWGQPVLRSKEWRADQILMTGGMSVWVLYAPEDGTQIRCLNGWIPFQMGWPLEEDLPEGTIRIRLLPRFVDARSVSPRRVLVRAGLAAMAQALSPMDVEISTPEMTDDRVELLQNTYPMYLPVRAGEKSFTLDEDLELPPSAPEPEKLLYYRIQPELTDHKVLGNKLVFRGNGNLHVLYASEEGQLFSWDFAMPFSQFAELPDSLSGDAQADIALCPISLEVNLDDEGHIRVKCSLVAQYVAAELQKLELTEDAYSPGREMTIQSRYLQLPAILETRQENLYGEQNIPAEAGIVTDVQFLPDFPRQRRTEQGICLEVPATVHILYYGEDRALQSASVRWEGRQELRSDGECHVTAVPLVPSAQIQPGSMQARLELPLKITVTGNEGIPMVTGGTVGQTQAPDPNRPSLILKRAGEDSLWELAKASGSTRQAIQKANGLEAEPVPGQLLLIPVTG